MYRVYARHPAAPEAAGSVYRPRRPGQDEAGEDEEERDPGLARHEELGNDVPGVTAEVLGHMDMEPEDQQRCDPAQASE